MRGRISSAEAILGGAGREEEREERVDGTRWERTFARHEERFPAS